MGKFADSKGLAETETSELLAGRTFKEPDPEIAANGSLRQRLKAVGFKVSGGGESHLRRNCRS